MYRRSEHIAPFVSIINTPLLGHSNLDEAQFMNMWKFNECYLNCIPIPTKAHPHHSMLTCADMLNVNRLDDV